MFKFCECRSKQILSADQTDRETQTERERQIDREPGMITERARAAYRNIALWDTPPTFTWPSFLASIQHD